MSAVDQGRPWLQTLIREHWLLLLILVIPINIAVGVWVIDWPWFALVLVVPIASVALGWIAHPRHIWVVWLGAVVILWISMGVWGRYNLPGPDESVISLILEAIVWMAVGVALPLWGGRGLAHRQVPSRS